MYLNWNFIAIFKYNNLKEGVMLKKINYAYIIFALFVFFILYSFYFILKTNENTKNNYLTIEKIELLNLLDKKFDTVLSKKLQYININDISKDIHLFNTELYLLKTMLSNNNAQAIISIYYQDLLHNFIKKRKLIQKFKDYNSLLVGSMQELLKLQSYIQKRYYFSPIGLEVNAVIVNFTQSALGKNEYIDYINKNLTSLNQLNKLNNLADKQLNTFINSSHLTLKYINDLNRTVSTKDTIHLNQSINNLKKYLILHFEKIYKKEKNFSYILLFIIISFLIVLIINYIVDKKHKIELLRFRKAVENSDNSIIITDPNKRITYVNSAFEKNTGYKKEETIGLNPSFLKSGHIEEENYKNLNNTLANLQTWDGEFINKKKNGEIFYEKASIVPIVMDDELNGFLAIKLDVTKYVQQQNDLLEQAERLKESQKIAHLGNWEINNLTKEVYFSEEMYKICEFEDKLNLKTFILLLHPLDKKQLILLLKQSSKEHKDGRMIHKILTKKNNVKYIDNRWYNKYDSNGNFIKVVGIALDITHIKTLENENKQKEGIMFQQSKMASMGEMFENIAHQWRQPLSVISTSASGIQVQKEFGLLTDEMLIDLTAKIVETTEHMSKTINDFRNFFKKNKNKEKINLKNSLQKTLSLLSSKLKNKNIQIIENMQDIDIIGLEGELIQSFMNIFSNAQDALIESKNENNFIFVDLLKENDFAIITIKDTAGGIPEDIVEHIFEPYFTTKHKSHGTGIGLYMTYEIIVKHHQGTIEVSNCNFEYEDNSYKGAQFTIKFKLSD